MTHTPGPWGWTYDGSSDYSIGPAEDPQANRVAHVWASNRNAEATAQAVANCRLMAAAPDLLTACKEALELIEQFVQGRVDVMERLELAIATAETGNHFIDDQ